MVACRELRVGDVIQDNDTRSEDQEYDRFLRVIEVGLTASRYGQNKPVVLAQRSSSDGVVYHKFRPTKIQAARIHAPPAPEQPRRRSGYTLITP